MHIDLICNDGSPIGVIPPKVEWPGVGGAELAMVSLMRTLAIRGHEVRVYNDPLMPGGYEGVSYLPLTDFQSENPRDALIIFRSPNARVLHERLPSSCRAIWWSTDQYTVGDFAALARKVDFVVTISPHHTKHHAERYGVPLDKMGHIDLGVRVEDYDAVADEPKVRNRLVFCSVPDRGLMQLHAAWPLIRRRVPDATLVITSDYTLWGSPNPLNHNFRLHWAGAPGVSFLGNVPRSELVRHQARAEVMGYPCIYDELFCLSVAECQVAGALPVTTAVGALPTTNEFGIIIPGDPRSPGWNTLFSDRVSQLLTEDRSYLEERQRIAKASARSRFDWGRIAARWESLFETAKLEAA